MREDLIAKRDLERERKLKKILIHIENQLDLGKTEEDLKKEFAEANSLVTSDGIVNEYVMRYYYGWTSMDGLVGELTINVPQIGEIREDEFREFVIWFRKIINDEIILEGMDFEYFSNYYDTFFRVNFRGYEDLSSDIYGGKDIEEMVIKLLDSYNNGNKNVILL